MTLHPYRLMSALAALLITLGLLLVVVQLGQPHPEEWLAHQSCRQPGSSAAHDSCVQQRLAVARRQVVAGR